MSSKNVPSSAEQTALLSAIGAVVGYIGGEAPTTHIFERILWPQHYFIGNIRPQEFLYMALLMPMGGPLHLAALRALDQLKSRGLLEGSYCGHMLGTAFYRDTESSYCVRMRVHRDGQMVDAATSTAGSKKQVRNGMWLRAVKHMSLSKHVVSASHGSRKAARRTRLAVNLLKLKTIRPGIFQAPPDRVVRDSPTSTATNMAVIAWSECTGIIVACVVFAIWRSAFGVLWIVPLLLKLLSAVFSVRREGLQGIEEEMDKDEVLVRYQIDMPEQGILIIEGFETLVQQFFRHYGHPIRSRIREAVQIAIIAAFGFNFLVGLTCSILFMSVSLQCVWLGYQLYATLALFIFRFCNGHRWATIEERIAQLWLTGEHAQNSTIYFDAHGEAMIEATLRRQEVDSNTEVASVAEEILATTMVFESAKTA